jgi:hypothetical protein
MLRLPSTTMRGDVSVEEVMTQEGRECRSRSSAPSGRRDAHHAPVVRPVHSGNM